MFRDRSSRRYQGKPLGDSDAQDNPRRAGSLSKSYCCPTRLRWELKKYYFDNFSIHPESSDHSRTISFHL